MHFLWPSYLYRNARVRTHIHTTPSTSQMSRARLSIRRHIQFPEAGPQHARGPHSTRVEPELQGRRILSTRVQGGLSAACLACASRKPVWHKVCGHAGCGFDVRNQAWWSCYRASDCAWDARHSPGSTRSAGGEYVGHCVRRRIIRRCEREGSL